MELMLKKITVGSLQAAVGKYTATTKVTYSLPTKMIRVISLIFISFLLTACYEPIEGCLDRRATNFDISIDEPCPDCCTYPTLKIRFDNKWQYPDTLLAFRTDTVFYDALDQPFRVNRIRFYWSNFRLMLSNGNELPITDFFEVKIPAGTDTMTLTVVDHFLLAEVNSSTDNLTLGAIVPEGSMTGFKTDFGIADPVNKAFISEMPENHVLSPQLGNLNYDTDIGYVFAQIEYFQDTTAIDTIPVVINIFGTNALKFLSFDLPVPVMLIEGFNPQLVIETDLARWFEGVNVRLGDTTVIQTQMSNNIEGSFTLKEVLFN